MCATSLRVLLVVALAALAAPVSAFQEPIPGLEVLQDTTRVQIIHLRDGSVLYGRIVDTGPPVVVRLGGGQLFRVEPSTVRSVETLEGRIVDGEVWEEDANPSRLFFAPTARTTPAGTGYFAVYELVIPFLSFSLTDRFMIAGGTPLLGDLGSGRPFYIAPKLQLVRRDRFQFAAGAWIIGTGDEDLDLISLLMGIATVGSTDHAVTVGLGYGFEGTRAADAVALIGGFETRLARRIKLVSENWYLPGDLALVSLGPRFMGSRLSADLGLGWLVGSGESFFIPLVNFVFTW
jgi:hypothetical protein